MTIRTDGLPWPLSPKLIAILEEEMERNGISTNIGAILTFRDPNYSADKGGFHPVEIAVGPGGRIEYITDLAYCGRPPQCELVKELDFDFSLGLFQHIGVEYPIRQGRDIFRLWESNFLAYHGMGVYTMSVELMG
jgi:hypothetical protein